MTSDFTGIDGRTFEHKARVARDDEQPAQARQLRQHLIGDDIAKEILRRIARQVDERKYRDRRQLARNLMAQRGWRAIFAYVRHETEALARQRFDQTPFLTAVANDAAHHVEPGGQSRIGDRASLPDRSRKLVLCDNAVTMLDEIGEQIKRLRRRRDDQPVRRNSCLAVSSA